jgi:hypothetical protein
MKLPIAKIAELTRIHRDTISKRIADLPFEAGKKGAKLYSSEDALAAIYKSDSLEAARAEQARSAAQLNKIRAEDLRKTRIPISIAPKCDSALYGFESRRLHSILILVGRRLRGLRIRRGL